MRIYFLRSGLKKKLIRQNQFQTEFLMYKNFKIWVIEFLKNNCLRLKIRTIFEKIKSNARNPIEFGSLVAEISKGRKTLWDTTF